MRKTCVILLPILFSFHSFAKKADQILGFWLSESGKAVIEIYKKENDKFEGKIVWLKDIHTGKVEDKLDKNNPDKELQKRSLQGLVNLTGFSFEDEEWEGGEIYDPESGKTYSAKMSLESPDTLSLRGYVGIPLFGRTSTWSRQKSKIPDEYQTKD
ncbi:MAG: DUF2147 domain-containing protein [Bacteriovoracaceae bacterium]|nr:DUF2147 domain-containing protein [Bacteriovoracaceae bacterium]